ncbi:uncharacterized protein [Littorina saxatilis]|uniref:Uncharacterized protein n=1 Tax=Littorina saxatilis TaxID=31220 RepID=A0AAN9GKU8_9CAEN
MQGVSVESVFFLLVWTFQFAFSQNQGQGGIRDANQFGSLLTAIETELDEEHPFYALTPSTPMPENINCYVEIPATRVGGQCIRMGNTGGNRRRGGRPSGGNRGNRRRNNPTAWGCQAGVHLDMGSPFCAPNAARGRARSNRLG